VLFCLHVGCFHRSETSEVNFGVLDVEILSLMITCQCIETKSITLMDQFFSHVNNLLLKSQIITLMDEMDFIYISGKKSETSNPSIGSDDAFLCWLDNCHYNDPRKPNLHRRKSPFHLCFCHKNRPSKFNVGGMVLFLFDLNFCHEKTPRPNVGELLYFHISRLAVTKMKPHSLTFLIT
jgi:hypothetical protein